MQLFNQPFTGQLGQILIDKLKNNYTEFTILSAFAKVSGVLRLKPFIEAFRANGGYFVAFIGVDAHGTSYEALIDLFGLCDELYIVHSETNMTTFHSKVYMLAGGDNPDWMAVGSNNLTGGGLWTNYETAVLLDGADEINAVFPEYEALISRYKNPAFACSKMISSTDDINTLFDGDYIRMEASIRSDRILVNHARRGQHGAPIFGTQSDIAIPRVFPAATSAGTQVAKGQNKKQQEHVTPLPHDIRPVFAIEENDNSERMWVETREMTGGSSNILDLSSIGSIAGNGDATGTRYQTDNDRYILGSVAFFDIDPSDTDRTQKDITIHYRGIDYTSNTIKYAPDNGSWRIQLHGTSASGDKIHLLQGAGWLRHKILIFEKIRTDYYSLSVLDEQEIDSVIEQSYVVAYNGRIGTMSKRYGMLS
ncbi:MAG: phospholipase D family protein [Clostridia bacterium]|nr:phospholipase D family protein [Clostridia bacterium]